MKADSRTFMASSVNINIVIFFCIESYRLNKDSFENDIKSFDSLERAKVKAYIEKDFLQGLAFIKVQKESLGVLVHIIVIL